MYKVNNEKKNEYRLRVKWPALYDNGVHGHHKLTMLSKTYLFLTFIPDIIFDILLLYYAEETSILQRFKDRYYYL